jgi:hypothetical protein
MVNLLVSIRCPFITGEFHDQGDAKKIVIRGKLRDHNNTPFGRATPGRTVDTKGVFGVLVTIK